MVHQFGTGRAIPGMGAGETFDAPLLWEGFWSGNARKSWPGAWAG